MPIDAGLHVPATSATLLETELCQMTYCSNGNSDYGDLMRRIVIGLCFVLTMSTALAQNGKLGHLRLQDRLDRPVDGYCLDIPGVGQSLRLQEPIFAHNCKPALTTDSAVTLRDDGKIVFPAVELCITVAGVNGKALPGAAILLRECGLSVPFFHAEPLQTFDFRDDGKLVLAGSNLCLAAGETSDVTYSVNDRWRVLSVEDCEQVPPKLARWEFNTGPFPAVQ